MIANDMPDWRLYRAPSFVRPGFLIWAGLCCGFALAAVVS